MGRSKKLKASRKIVRTLAADHDHKFIQGLRPPLWRRVLGVLFPGLLVSWLARMGAVHKIASAGAQRKLRNMLKR